MAEEFWDGRQFITQADLDRKTDKRVGQAYLDRKADERIAKLKAKVSRLKRKIKDLKQARRS